MTYYLAPVTVPPAIHAGKGYHWMSDSVCARIAKSIYHTAVTLAVSTPDDGDRDILQNNGY
jgi:hypothetical protein